MSDFKSKLPDFKELSSMTSKLFKSIKASVDEIIKDYKEKRAEDEAKEKATETQAAINTVVTPPIVNTPPPVDVVPPVVKEPKVSKKTKDDI